MSQFAFLQAEFPAVFEAAAKAEAVAIPDPRTACFYIRRALELLVEWVFTYDRTVEKPYQDSLSAKVHEPTFQAAAGPAVFQKARYLVKVGNQAVHSTKPVSAMESTAAAKELFHVAYWLMHTYGKGAKPPAGAQLNLALLPQTAAVPKQTIDQLKKLEADLQSRDEKLASLAKDKESLDEQLRQAREELAAVKAANAATPDTHDYSEEETRDRFIDLLLKEAGWPLDQDRDREFPVDGLPPAFAKSGKGKVDYVLWGDDGLPLGVVEAKRTRKDPRTGQAQAKVYADALEARYGRRPFLFYTNGYEHWFWDDSEFPQRPVQGFYKKDELERLIQARTGRTPLRGQDVDPAIVERYYQTRAVRKVCEAFEADKLRRALLVMATGAGKTRTVIALSELLMRCGWAKRVLFLADRKALVEQGAKAFRKHLPNTTTVNLVSERDGEGRVFASTYPTMMGLIDDTRDGGVRRFGVGHFDLIVIDEAHRSVFHKYKAIFEYFDARLVGLTATPKGEVDKNTYELFLLQTGVPTDAYQLEDAVKDGYLVPAKSVSVPLKFPREGIKKYEDLSEEDKERWDELEWETETGEIPDEVSAAALNSWLFNADTVDKMLAHLMTKGAKVAGGDRLGKTMIFAKNEAHARFIAERFNRHYPQYAGHFAQVITNQTVGAQHLIDQFGLADKPPHIAISVDMLDTGIDVPEVVNLVFFKMVRSKTKFWQMVGRGTRLCPDLFGPGKDKKEFFIFDFCGNLEFFAADPESSEGGVGESLSEKLFRQRLELLAALDGRTASAAEGTLRTETADLLRQIVAAMNLDNFVVRPKRKLVEEFAKTEAWANLSAEVRDELSRELAALPTELPGDGEEAKRFDLLLLKLQLAVLKCEPSFVRLKANVVEIAGLLEEKAAIPMVAAQLPLIQELQSEEWWQDATAPMLETVRKKLRELVRFIEKAKRNPVYTNFEDTVGEATEIELPGFGTPSNDFALFRAKARAFLRQHQDNPSLVKLRRNQRLTPDDLAELDRLLAASGAGTAEEIAAARGQSNGLAAFVRSLVGLDREAAKAAFAGFAAKLGGNQIEFVNLMIDHLTEYGTIDAGELYDAPFTDVAPRGPDALFPAELMGELVAVLGGLQPVAV